MGLPTLEELEALPRLARLAFIRRCVSRLTSLVRLSERKDLHSRVIQTAMEVIDGVASGKRMYEGLLRSALANLLYSLQVFVSRKSSSPVLAHRSRVVYLRLLHMFVRSAHSRTNMKRSPRDFLPTYQVMDSMSSLLNHQYCDRFLEDYFDLLKHVLAGGWGDRMTVSQSVFGPLWPDGGPGVEEVGVLMAMWPRKIG